MEGNCKRGNGLKLEVHILKSLKKHNGIFANVLQSGKKSKYSYVVMTLLGASLESLLSKDQSSISTLVRVGINALYGIKAIHDMGFIHRDIKPANMALGTSDRILHIFDFGLARQFVIFVKNGRPKLRRPRPKARFRGTLRYCSINAQQRCEQGRPDDLWSLLYMLIEMRGPLPWANIETDRKILDIKIKTTPQILLKNCPSQFMDVYSHLLTLNYYIRPDYSLFYSALESKRRKDHIKFSDPYDWEADGLQLKKQEHVKGVPFKPGPVKSSSATLLTQSSSTIKSKETCSSSGSFEIIGKDLEPNPFPAAFFSSNPLGF